MDQMKRHPCCPPPARSWRVTTPNTPYADHNGRLLRAPRKCSWVQAPCRPLRGIRSWHPKSFSTPAGDAPVVREQRKLAAVLAADVVGYSRLMGRDESGTLARLREHRRSRLEPTLAR